MRNNTPRPQADFDLSQGHVESMCHVLLLNDWLSPAHPMILSAAPDLDDLQDAPLFQDARELLLLLEEEGGTPATITGNLNRAFVKRLHPRLALSALTREMHETVFKVLNETDVDPLNRARFVCSGGGLILLRKKRFTVTKAGRSLLAADRAGELFRRLFVAYFRRYDLSYDSLGGGVQGIQDTAAISLWRMSDLCRDWVPVRGLAPMILFPSVLDDLRRSLTSPWRSEEDTLCDCLLTPLRRMGLVEARHDTEPGNDRVPARDEIRITPLWEKFIRFSRIVHVEFIDRR